MTKIHHFSFDVWNTLVVSNPEFASKRTQALAELAGMTTYSAKLAYTTVKRMIDNAAESHGLGLSTDGVLMVLKTYINATNGKLTTEHMLAFKKRIAELFKEHPPIVTDSARYMLCQLAHLGPTVTTSIGSNSNFISGDLMHPYLTEVFKNYHVKLSFGVYSDLIHVSKPHPQFFDEVFKKAQENNNIVQTRGEVCHVGDNIVCDGKVVDYNMQFLHTPDVNKIGTAIEQLLNANH